MNDSFLFTSESVSNGHPDKIADQISDAVLDALLTKDKEARVAVETYVKTGMVLVGGEITTNSWVDIESITRDTIREIGYIHSDMGFDGNSCAVLNAIGKQSPDIAQGVDESQQKEQGAGDQGMMFGYATNETPEYMPAPILYAHKLMQQHALLRKQKKFPWLRPDAKTQITFRYDGGKPVEITCIVLSTQHSEDIQHNDLKEAVIEEIIQPMIPRKLLSRNIQYLINPTGRFVVGGPMGDCGLTGRKIIVDTYGGMARHGGGAFSGKDPSKVDRSAAYAARHVAKNMVHAGLAERLEVQIAYAIGKAAPLALYVNSFNTGKHPDEKLARIIQANFDLRPKSIIERLKLLQPIYQKTASYGHFGRNEVDFMWEKTETSEQLRGL